MHDKQGLSQYSHHAYHGKAAAEPYRAQGLQLQNWTNSVLLRDQFKLGSFPSIPITEISIIQ